MTLVDHIRKMIEINDVKKIDRNYQELRELDYLYSHTHDLYIEDITKATDEEVKNANDFLESILDVHRKRLDLLLTQARDYEKRTDILEYLRKDVVKEQDIIMNLRGYQESLSVRLNKPNVL